MAQGGGGGAGGNQQNLAALSSSRLEVKVQVWQPPSRLCPKLGVRDPRRLRGDKLSLGPAGPWKVCGRDSALTSNVALHNPSRFPRPPPCPLQAPRVSLCDLSPFLASSLIPRVLHRLSFLLPNPLDWASPPSRVSLTVARCAAGPQRTPPTPPPHQRAGVTQPACNCHLTPQAWILRNEKESPAAPPRLPASAQELKGARGGGGGGGQLDPKYLAKLREAESSESWRAHGSRSGVGVGRGCRVPRPGLPGTADDPLLRSWNRLGRARSSCACWHRLRGRGDWHQDSILWDPAGEKEAHGAGTATRPGSSQSANCKQLVARFPY